MLDIKSSDLIFEVIDAVPILEFCHFLRHNNEIYFLSVYYNYE